MRSVIYLKPQCVEIETAVDAIQSGVKGVFMIVECPSQDPLFSNGAYEADE